MTKPPIIAFVDGSHYSFVICEYAAHFAKKLDLPVKLYHVVRPNSGEPARDLSGAINLGARSKLLDALTTADELQAKEVYETGREILETAKRDLQKLGVTQIETRLRAGDIAQSLSTKEKTGELVIIGKRGEVSAQNKVRLGKNFERLVRASSKPVFVSNADFRRMTRVIVAFDGSAPAYKALTSVKENPLFSGCKITVLTVNGSQNQFNEDIRSAIDDKWDIEWKDISGSAKQVILNEVKTGQYDVLAMGAYGHTKLRNFFIGSTTTALINTTRVPILLCK